MAHALYIGCMGKEKKGIKGYLTAAIVVLGYELFGEGIELIIQGSTDALTAELIGEICSEVARVACHLPAWIVSMVAVETFGQIITLVEIAGSVLTSFDDTTAVVEAMVGAKRSLSMLLVARDPPP